MNNPVGFICYNNSELLRDGYIYPSLNREYDISSFSDISKWENRIEGNTRKGIRYIPYRDNGGTLYKVVETRQQLPANKISIEVLFSKTMRNAVTHPIEPGSFGGFGVGSLLSMGVGFLGLGGITSSITDMTYHICDSETIVNYQIIVTEELKKTGIYKFDGYILSVYAIVKEHELLEKEKDYRSLGLNFTEDQLKNIGKYSLGSYQGGPILRVTGATDSKGQFGGIGETEVNLENVMFDDQENLFKEIIYDDRIFNFRGDNIDASGKKQYPFESKSKDDITSQEVRIDVSNLEVGDKIYATLCMASNRRLRQSIRHKGTMGQGNTQGIVGWNMEIGSDIDVFDYKIKTWLSPTQEKIKNRGENFNGFNINIASIDTVIKKSFYDVYKKDISDPDKTYLEDNLNDYEEIEGWRLSSINTNSYNVDNFWTMDKRGIVHVSIDDTSDVSTKVVISNREMPRTAKKWFNDYVNSLKYPDKNVEDYIDPSEEEFFLFDISYPSNSLLLDKQKIPYQKKFAEYIQNTEYIIGVPILDILYYYEDCYNINIFDFMYNNVLNIFAKEEQQKIYILSLYDISNSHFDKLEARPYQYSCDEEYNYKLYYNCHVTNPGDYNQVYFSGSYIDNNVLEWRPDGGTIESYWLLQTPYFCGNFTRDSRIYMEHIGGNSLCNFSQIYADTIASIPSTISLGHDIYTDEQLLCFSDNNYHNSLSYYFFNDGQYYNDLIRSKIDKELNHNRLEFDHDNMSIIGNSKLLGGSPNYENGMLLTDIISYLCERGEEDVKYHEYEESGYNILQQGMHLDNNYSIFRIFLNIKCITAYNGNLKNKISIAIDDKIITNIFIPDKMNVGDEKYFPINIGYYGGKELKFGASEQLLGYITINKIELWGFNNNVIDNYKIKSEQSSVVFDREGRILIFYHNEINSNISALLSCDNGISWTGHHNLIRLFGNENASYPYVIDNYDNNVVNLFYILNDKFLMLKKINTNDFIASDSFMRYNRLDFYMGNTDEDIKNYSYNGKILRSNYSYFIEGDSESSYYKEQRYIYNLIKDKNDDVEEIDFKNKIRFYFNEKNEDNLNKSFDNKAYFVHQDNYGNSRLFYLKNNKLSIKRSSDKINWIEEINDIPIHKNFIDEDIEKEEFAISIIQKAKFFFDNNVMGLIYVHNGMMFIRYFQLDMLLHSDIDNSDDVNNSILYNQLLISNDKKDNFPIFLVGKLSNQIKMSLKNDFEQGIAYEDSNRLVYFPYEEDMIDKFNDDFAIDSTTQPHAYKVREGLNRIFYKDINGKLNALLINGMYDISFECMFKDKNKDIDE
ncbi:hypothetical protein K9M42_02735 [Patescibacteria group bacterium]|nr:hypothetical protein [Patescibacteria group bacterium]